MAFQVTWTLCLTVALSAFAEETCYSMPKTCDIYNNGYSIGSNNGDIRNCIKRGKADLPNGAGQGIFTIAVCILLIKWHTRKKSFLKGKFPP